MEQGKVAVAGSSDSFSCIAVDMGASSIRIMLGTAGNGRVDHQEVRRMDNRTVFSEGHERWDIDLIVNEIIQGIRDAWELSGQSVESFGIDCWGVDFVLLDAAGELVENPVSYRDERTEGMQEIWEKEMPAMETYIRTGINFYQFNTLFQLLSIRDSKALKKTSTLLFLPSYICFLLTGMIYNELTIASTSQLLEVEGDHWEPDILQRLRIGEELFGRVIMPGTRLGAISHPELAETKIEGVAVCGHDTACVVSAIPSQDPDYVYISAGTWCIVGIESGAPLLSEEAFRSGFTNERGYGNSYRVLKNIVGLWLIQGLKQQLPDRTTFSELEAMATESDDTLHLIDPEDPVFYNPPRMKLAFDTYFQKTGQDLPAGLGGYLRCAYQSLCYSFRYHIELLEKLSGRRFRVIHMVGGGSQSDFLNRHIAAICDRPVVAGPAESAAVGNILIQAITMGRVAGLEEGKAMVRDSYPLKRFLPGQDPEPIRQQYERFLSIRK